MSESMSTPLRLLLIEDSDDDALLIVHELRHGAYEVEWQRVDTAAALTAALEQGTWDAITCDWAMPELTALAALTLLREQHVDVPIIIVSGEVGEEVAVTAMKAGAHDFVSKHRLARLSPAMARELRESEVRRAHRAAQAALSASEERYRDLVEHSHDLLCTHGLDGRILSINPAPAKALGYEPAEILGMNLRDILAPEARQGLPAYLQAIREHGIATGLMTVLTRSGKRRVWEYTNTLRTEGVAAPIVRGVAHDVTERVRAEAVLAAKEHHFRSLVENALDLVSIVELNGVLRYVSPSHERALGFTVAELTGMSAFDFIHPDDQARFRHLLVEGLQTTGATAVLDYRFRRRDGSWAVIEAVAKNLLDDPIVAGVLVNSRDITERRLAEEESRHYRQRLNRAQAVGHVGSWEYDVEEGRLWASEESYRIFGWPASFGDVTLAQVEDRIPDRERVHQALENLIDRGDPYDLEFAINPADGSPPRIISSQAELRTTEQSGRKVVGVIQDVTERHRAEADIRRLNAELEARVRERTTQLEAANRELEAFSSSVSHDLRAPLRAIAGFSQALLEEHAAALDAEGRGYLDRILAGTRRMADLIQDLLGLSRVTRQEMSPEEVDLSAVAHDITAALRRNDPERRVDVVIAPGLRARGDGPLCRLALENLLGNAWKYTSRHAAARIEFGVTERDGRRVYFVRDDGAGFDMACAARLFGVFQRLHTAAEFEGTGIGLATVQRVVQRHGGCIWAESAVEHGATFYFTLGAAPP